MRMMPKPESGLDVSGLLAPEKDRQRRRIRTDENRITYPECMNSAAIIRINNDLIIETGSIMSVQRPGTT